MEGTGSSGRKVTGDVCQGYFRRKIAREEEIIIGHGQREVFSFETCQRGRGSVLISSLNKRLVFIRQTREST